MVTGVLLTVIGLKAETLSTEPSVLSYPLSVVDPRGNDLNGYNKYFRLELDERGSSVNIANSGVELVPVTGNAQFCRETLSVSY